MENNNTGTGENITNWLEQEEKSMGEGKVYEKLPSVQFEENKIVTIEVDFTKPFEKWTGESRGRAGQVTKAIIPCLVNGTLQNFWLNVKNPLYAEIIKLGKTGQRSFNIIQIGTKAATQYKIVK